MDPQALQDLLQRARQALANGAAFADVDAMVREDSGFDDFSALLRSPEARGLQDVEAEESDGIGVRDVVRSVAQGALFGFADEIAGVGAAIVPGGRGFSEAVEESRIREEAFKRQHPTAAAALEIGGALASSFIPAGAAINVARGARAAGGAGRVAARTLGGTAARAAGLGAAETVLDELGRGEGGLGERLEGTGQAGLIGASIGGAFPVVGRAARSVTRRVGDIVRPERAIARRADEALAGAVAPEGTAAARRTLREIEEVRPGQATLADVSPQAQSQLDVAVSASPAAAQAAEEVLGPRQAGAAGRIIRDIENIVGAPPNVRAATEAHAKELSELGRRLYEPLEQNFPRIEARSVRRPAGTPGAGQFVSHQGAKAVRDFVERPVVRRAFRAVNAVEQMIDPRAAAPSFKQLQDIRIKLGRAADRFAAQGDRRGARDFLEAKRQLTDLMEDVVPGFRSANAQYARLASIGDALEEGSVAWRKGARDVAERIAQLEKIGGQRAGDAFRLSMIEGLIDDLRGIATDRNVSRRFTAASQDFAEHLRLAFPSELQLGELLRRADIEDLFAKTAAAGGNSATARRTAAFAELAGERGISEAALGGAVRGGIPGAVSAGLGEVSSRVSGRPREFLGQVSQRLGEALTDQDHRGLLEVLDRLDEVQARLQSRIDRAALTDIGVGVLAGRGLASQQGEPRADRSPIP